MAPAEAASPLSEENFARIVDALGSDPARRSELIGFLDERHSVYRERGTAAVARMRGWTLLTLARRPLQNDEVVFVLEELQTGRTAYEVACAARAMRSTANPVPAMASLLLRAAANVRAVDDHVDLVRYGGVNDAEDASSTATDVLIDTLAWLGTAVAGVREVVETALQSGDPPLSPRQRERVERCLAQCTAGAVGGPPACCTPGAGWTGLRRWLARTRADPHAIAFEDQDGGLVRYGDFFRGQPTVVVFFYTRCNNAGKCSLSVSKLARIQRMLVEAGLGHRVQTAAITYDPDYDLAPRLRGYAQSRGMRMDARNRVMRSVEGAAELRLHFELGVNFISSIVNRHRIEAFLVDGQGNITTSFERLQWDEQQVMSEAVALADRTDATAPADACGGTPPATVVSPAKRKRIWLAPLAYLAMALLPKCPICGATYLSLSGIMALPHLGHIYWMVPALAVLVVINLASLGWLARTREDWRAFALALLGGALTIGGGIALDHQASIYAGIAVSLIGGMLGLAGTRVVLGGGRANAGTTCARPTLRLGPSPEPASSSSLETLATPAR